MSEPKRPRVLFLCTGTSCRSQMAEALCQHFHGKLIDAVSAGIERHGMNPNAVRVIQELGIPMAGHSSKTLDDLPDMAFDFVITVCDHANESCPVFPGKAIRLHRSFDDPPKLAKAAATQEEALAHYRRVRDEIKDFILTLPDELQSVEVE